MGGIVDLKEWKVDRSGQEKINHFLKRASEINLKISGKVERGVFILETSLQEVLEKKFNQILLEEKLIDEELFRCALYLSQVFDGFIKKVPASYYSVDYVIDGWEKDVRFFREGGEFCSLICTFFDGYASRKARRFQDFAKMGAYLYYLYFCQTQSQVAWCMSNNFRGIMEVAKRGIETL